MLHSDYPERNNNKPYLAILAKFRKAWHALDPEFELLESFIKARGKAGLSQATIQSVVGRGFSDMQVIEIENGADPDSSG
ncbi:MAG: hypothetical protein HY758_02075 [Nitrospirae bacterium]|nr:hypothetical protein [Nitrospirota bacterium]